MRKAAALSLCCGGVCLQADKAQASLLDDDALYFEGFACKIFGKADALDRGGRSDANTAKALYASSIFFEVLRQWGELAPELAAKQKYAAWRAAEIRSAVKEGRLPAPAPSSQTEESEDAPVPALHDFPRPPSGLAPPAPTPSTPPPSGSAGGASYSPAVERGRPSLAPTPSPPPGLKPPVYADLPAAPSASGLPAPALVEAQTAAKVAASALAFDDIPTAVANLRKALHALGAAP